MMRVHAQGAEPDERRALLRALAGAEGLITPESLTEVCGLIELMLDPAKTHGERRRYGRPIAAALLRRYDARYGAPALLDGRPFYHLDRLLSLPIEEPYTGSCLQEPINHPAITGTRDDAPANLLQPA